MEVTELREKYAAERRRHQEEIEAAAEAQRRQRFQSREEIEAEIEAATRELRATQDRQQGLLAAWQEEVRLREDAIRRGEDVPPPPPEPDLSDERQRNGDLTDRLQRALEARDFGGPRPGASVRRLAPGELSHTHFDGVGT